MVYTAIQEWQTLLTLKTSDEDNVRYKQSLLLSCATFCNWKKISEKSQTVWTDRPHVYYPWNILLWNMKWGARFKVLTAAFLRISVFWDVTLCFQEGSWNKCHAFNLRVKQAKKARLPDPEDKGTIFLWNVRKCSPHNTVTPLSEAHTLHMSVACSWPAYRQNMFTDLIISRVDLNCKSYHYSQCYNHKTEHNNVKITATLISRTTKATRNWSPPIGPITSSTRLQRKWLCLLWAAVWPRNTWHTATCEMKCHVLLVLYQHITSTMFCTILHIVHSD